MREDRKKRCSDVFVVFRVNAFRYDARREIFRCDTFRRELPRRSADQKSKIGMDRNARNCGNLRKSQTFATLNTIFLRRVSMVRFGGAPVG